MCALTGFSSNQMNNNKLNEIAQIARKAGFTDFDAKKSLKYNAATGKTELNMDAYAGNTIMRDKLLGVLESKAGIKFTNLRYKTTTPSPNTPPSNPSMATKPVQPTNVASPTQPIVTPTINNQPAPQGNSAYTPINWQAGTSGLQPQSQFDVSRVRGTLGATSTDITAPVNQSSDVVKQDLSGEQAFKEIMRRVDSGEISSSNPTEEIASDDGNQSV